MESDYDRKFEEMKSYIPFLESMLTRLSVGSSTTNPRQAQLDKIRSLRDLLLNKKKRMKMENLLKCEQVLITLHAKVAMQKDAATESKSKENSSNLNFARNKLKSVVSKLSHENLPNIARANDIPQVDFQGNKEPALFQRRPNQKSLSPTKSPLSDKKTSPQSSKRNYTRVLHSPENSLRHWPETEKPLFSRRSPRNISKRHSPLYRKGKKKSKKSKHTQLNDFNITLNVPEDKLNSLDTEDILSRIINCSDSDVEIATLRELRSQILGELKHTGVKDDISDLLLKSCKTNKIKNKAEKPNEVEEGELSDSESEAIENIYGNLIITNKDSFTVEPSEKNKSRKIQICLVINSDKNEQQAEVLEASKSKSSTNIDSSDFELFSQTKTCSEVVTDFIKTDENQLPQDNLPGDTNKVNDLHPIKKDELGVDEQQEIPKDNKPIGKDVKLEEKNYTFNENVVMEDKQGENKINCDVLSQKHDNESVLLQDNQHELNKSKCFVPNFYNPTNDVIKEPDSVVESKNPAQDVTNMSSTVTIISSKEEELVQLPNKKGSVEIPFLNLEEIAKQEIVSEIDILQALKKEILGESTTSATETMTPALHQPKITKVASAQEIVKKRISIENYKQKCQDPPQPVYFHDISEKRLTDDQCKKQSIKLTEKECERFNLPTKLPLNDSSDDDNDVNISLVDVYSEMAPKSPDHEDFADTGIKPPVIIPCDPVKPSVINFFVDIDMRSANNVSQILNDPSIVSETKKLNVNNEAEKQIKLSDPRKSNIQPDIDILLPPVNATNSSENQRPNMTPSRNLSTPNMTPSRKIASNTTSSPLISSNITPNFVSNKTYEMTPSRLISEDIPGRKYVYAPTISGANTCETNESRYKDVSETGVWEANTISRDMEYDARYSYGRFDRPQTSIHSYGRHETPTTSLFGKIECPSTPLPSFGRMECPTTPLPSFGRTERGMTPVNSYTRVDGSSTPIHPYDRTDETITYNRSFDRLDGSSTPIHSYGHRDITPSNYFGRHDRPGTPIHSFGEQDGSGTPAYSYNYLEGSTTPCHTFEKQESYGRNDYVRNYHSTRPMYGRTDRRFTKSSDYDNYNRQVDQEYVPYRERIFRSDYSSGHRGSEYYRWYEQNFGRTEMNRYQERYSKDNISGKNQFNKYSLTKDRDTSSRRNNRDYKFYNERNYTQPEKSAETNNSTNRATAHSYEKDSCNRAFVIDKSVSTTFQKFEEKDRTLHSFDSRRQRAASVGRINNFDKRRQRAASVGRVLTSEQSFDRTKQDLKLDKLDSNNKRKDFHRASSVGRELQSRRSESFINIKNDLQSFKLKNDLNVQKKFGEKKSDTNKQSQSENNKSADIKKTDDKHPIQRKSFNERYSLRNNYREPRLRESRLKYEKSQFHYQRKSGIIYSDANISKGTILGPGCSVKNYKIPKIKRSPEKTTENHTDSVDVNIKKSEDKTESIDLSRQTKRNSGNKGHNNYNIKYEDCKATTSNKKCVKEENVEERIDSSSNVKTDDSNEDFIIRRSKRIKTKSVVYDDSDSDSEKKIETVQQNSINAPDPTLQKTEELNVTVLDFKSIQNDSSVSIDDTKMKGKTHSSESFEDNANKEAISTQAKPTDFQSSSCCLDSSEHPQSKDINQQSSNINKNNLSKEISPVGTNNGTEELNSFGDLEIFSENIVTDPILNNINELIADLDHDLDTTKNNEVRTPFRQDFLLDHMFDSIKQDNIIKEDENKSGGNQKTSIDILTEEKKFSSVTKDMCQDQVDNLSNNSDSVTKATPDSLNYETETVKVKKFDVGNSNDAIVSTTKDDMKSLSEGNRLKHCHITFESKPDSTINSLNQYKSVEEIVPDSTNESNEDNELISSSNTETTNNTLNVDSLQSTDKNDSIGNFLSILQDKSKIKELLDLLGEHAPENEKIKRKLLKLSAIVSDDEDDNIDNLSVANNENVSAENMNEKRQNNIDKEEKLKQQQNDLSEMSIPKKAETGDLNKIVEKLDNTAEILKQGDNLELDVTDATKNDTENLKNIEKNKTLHSDVEPEFETEQKYKTTRKGRPKKMGKGSCLPENRKIKSGAVAKTKVKKPSRELLNLQADIRNNYLKEDEEILGGTTGLRMCRLAKLVDGKTQRQTRAESPKEDTTSTVRAEKLKKNEDTIRGVETISKRKKSNKNIKNDKQNKVDEDSHSTVSQNDPYLFETDSVCESLSTSEKRDDSTEDDSDSAESFKSESCEKHIPGVVKKRPKRKRGAWQSGIIVPKNRKKKSITPKVKAVVLDVPNNAIDEGSKLKILDLNFYIDKSYCFSKNILVYDCRLCDQKASDIVYHYKKEHPHTEIPLSRMSPDIALEAIKQCETLDFLAISQIPNNRYVCRFCFKEFVNCKTLENFFWHIVSTHTGEYKQSCPVCIEDEKCPLALDIPPLKQTGQLIGFICGNCNYTQLSLENLKTHVITRHNDEQTEVYTINMSHMSAKSLNMLLRRTKILKASKELEEQRVLRSGRSNVSAENALEKINIGEENDHESISIASQELNLPISKKNTTLNKTIKSKISYETDSDSEKMSRPSQDISYKVKDELKDTDEIKESGIESVGTGRNTANALEGSYAPTVEETVNDRVNDIDESPHFKVIYNKSGFKQYVCCISDYAHYKTALLISFKKHVQTIHVEKWDGYCCICKVIVMPQGVHSYKNCLDHFIDKHLDNFPVIENTTEKVAEKPTEQTVETNVESVSLQVRRSSPKPFLSVRPLAELLPNNESYEASVPSPLPLIESVLSLTSEPGLICPTQEKIQDEPKRYLYEEAQAEVLSAKNRIILDAMMTHEKLVQVFKCAGRFCSYTTDSAEDALLHVSTHKRVGGVNALKCAYCDFDCLDNAIDLVTHVFKSHGFCQYVCSHCFYRAAASQLVNAHITRVHENVAVKTVLKTSFMTEPIEGNILSREAAVPIYVCNCEDDEPGSKCNFKTYTPGKLCDHVKSKHKDVTAHECFICKASTDSVGELLHHYKEHGLKLYQCAWCVFGADNETELLTHSSIHHAACQPKAYLRVITNKEGTTEFRVLPLAHLNKSNTPNTTDMDVTNRSRENPVREAERSIDLEKLIGPTTSFIVPMAATDKETPNEILLDELSIAESMLNLVPQPVSRPNTPFATVAMNQQSTPIIKIEEATTNTPDQRSSDVICLDSDEEDIPGLHMPKQISPITPIQEPASSVTGKTRTRVRSMYKCANCSVMSKNASAFKTHLGECFKNTKNIGFQCAHCPFMGSKKKLICHYKQAHLQNMNVDPLNDSESSPGSLGKGTQHNDNNADIVLSAKKVGGVTVRELAAKKNPKRKSSAASSDEPPVKIKKYGPHEISHLPINPIFDNFVYCSICEFNTKVRLNMVRHLQLHASQRPVPQTVPVNPVPHLETNEMHFDKMVNLASSSLVTRLDKGKRNETSTIPLPPERVSWYPKYVPERTRHTCGAKDCSYISVDENMLKYHWETLHSGSTDFHCVHCPPYQTLDKRTPLSASRIIAHLKMHDAKLYACSQCKFYHFKQTVVEKHVNEVHKIGNVLVVREEITSASQMNITAVPPSPAPTMDLKPWQCGLCEYKSLLRPEVVEHCAKFHTSKMQFKCVYCAFRTSNEENITKHQLKSHQELPAQTFYFYYREGSVPGEVDGTPFWKMQINKFSFDFKIKSEKGAETATTSTTPVTTTPAAVNLSLVKQEVVEENIESLCQKFGQFCEPNGIRYKCPLCKTVIEDTKEAMQSHLFEELQYRRWRCSICLYKAFHKHGLKVHMETEHHVNRDPVELPIDSQVETWVTSLLEHQETIIGHLKNKLAKQKAEIHRVNEDVHQLKSLLVQQTPTTSKTTNIPSTEELETKFGTLGTPKGSSFCCPKCNEVIEEESAMRDHLESELNKIRWCCSTCPETFTSYHQAQFHCKIHLGQSSRPVEAPRDSVLRSAWVDAAVEVQKVIINSQPLDMEQRRGESPEPQENSLLVVRYEESVPTPEALSFRRRKSTDSDDDCLVRIKKRRARGGPTSCPYCEFSPPKKKILNEHILKHYNLKPYTCEYCQATGTLKNLRKHQKIYHAMKPVYINPTIVPTITPIDWFSKKITDVPSTEIICLTCQSRLPQSELPGHLHDNTKPEFGRIGEVIVRCSTCSTLHKDIHKFEEHKIKEHPNEGNYVFYKLSHENRQGQAKCSYCPQKFTLKKDLKTHIESSHAEALKYATIEPQSSKDVIVLDDEDDALAEVTVSPRKMVARKSTSKLPFFKTVARKSTSKLPMESQEEYSFYGSKSRPDGLGNVTTMMPFYNSFVPITFGRLNKVLNVNPRIVLKKLPNVKEH